MCHQLTSLGFTWKVKLFIFHGASILPAFWGNRGFFFYPEKKRAFYPNIREN